MVPLVVVYLKVCHSYLDYNFPLLRPNKKKYNVFRIKSLKILCRVGTHVYFNFFWKKINFTHLKGILPFKMHKIIFFPEKRKKILGFTSKFR